MRMTDVPLFPLGTVLFPQMILPLQIFEQRYRLMINECLKNNTPFGVVLLQEGDEVQEGRDETEPARPCAVGTLARITEVVKSPDGRMLLTTVGTERFRLMEYRNDKPYMTGDIEIWPDETSGENSLEPEVSQVRAAFEVYLKILMDLAGKEIQGLEIPNEPDVLSYLVPNWLQISLSDKQRLLEAATIYERLRAERQILEAESQFLGKIKEKADQESMLNERIFGEQDEEDAPASGRPADDLGSRFSKN